MPACSPDLFKKLKPFGKEALNQAPLIVHQSRPWAWHQWAEENDIADFSPKRIVQVDSMFSVARAAQQGIGIALIPLPLSQNWFDEGVIFPLFEQQLQTRDKYYLIQHDWHASREDLDVFVQWLLSEFSQ
jgi:LysR family glycine cleavage system transcriptional activator